SINAAMGSSPISAPVDTPSAFIGAMPGIPMPIRNAWPSNVVLRTFDGSGAPSSPSGSPPDRPLSVQGVHQDETVRLAEVPVRSVNLTMDSPKPPFPGPNEPLPVMTKIELSGPTAGPAPPCQMPPPQPVTVEHQVAAIRQAAGSTAINQPRAVAALS